VIVREDLLDYSRDRCIHGVRLDRALPVAAKSFAGRVEANLPVNCSPDVHCDGGVAAIS
jgi:hypothetical protein